MAVIRCMFGVATWTFALVAVGASTATFFNQKFAPAVQVTAPAAVPSGSLSCVCQCPPPTTVTVEVGIGCWSWKTVSALLVLVCIVAEVAR